MSNLKRLENKRKTFISRISEYYSIAVQSSTDPSKRGQLKSSYADISEIFDRYSEYHNEVIMLVESDEEFDIQEKVRKDTEHFYYESLSIYHSLNQPDARMASLLSVEASAKLPPLNIPHFDGDPKSVRIRVMQSYLTDRQQSVRVENKLSDRRVLDRNLRFRPVGLFLPRMSFEKLAMFGFLSKLQIAFLKVHKFSKCGHLKFEKKSRSKIEKTA
ncbi:hypothetical protein WA026_021646 [Henosepilachna vigintioctopunctata]|uniref:Uncharacterized protein n=1 Tax=Henosepilachna vigintioctopunctata TaxID=420089 RepID=A0AAW1UCE3_9CUCU